jgi:hypothetical protein
MDMEVLPFFLLSEQETPKSSIGSRRNPVATATAGSAFSLELFASRQGSG